MGLRGASRETRQASGAAKLIPRLRPEFSLRDLAASLVGSDAGFMDSLAREMGRDAATWTPSGRAGLATALAAVGCARAIVPAFNCWAVMEGLVHAGVEPVFVDVGPDLNPDPDQSMSELRVADKHTALILTHQFGVPMSGADELVRAARARGVPVIEDGAAALGAQSAAGAVGSAGDISVLSFQYTKTVIAGEGGALLYDEGLLGPVERAARYRNARRHKAAVNFMRLVAFSSLTHPALYGGSLYQQVRREGTANLRDVEAPRSRFEELPAGWMRALARRTRSRQGEWLAARRRMAAVYLDALGDLPVETVPGTAAANAAPIRFPVLVRDRASVIAAAADVGLDLGRSFSYVCSGPGFPNAERVAAQIVNLPLSAALESRAADIATRFRTAIIRAG